MKLLVIGATGSYGRSIVREALVRGHQIRALVRRSVAGTNRASSRELPAAVEVVEGDALSARDVERAARGVDAIIHGFNAPYPVWQSALLEAAEAVSQAAVRHGLRVVLPGNVYGLGVPDGEAGEGVQKRPVSKKGGVRNALEARLERATE